MKINYSNSIHLFNNQLYKKSITYDYFRFNSTKYKVDYIIGTSENCEVEIKKNNISDTNELETIDKLSTKNNRIILDFEELYFTSLNCDAVITIIPDINSNYKNYSGNNVQTGYLEENSFAIFKIPQKEYNKNL